MQEKYAAQGFVVLAAHCQDVTRDKVVMLCRSKHINYTVISGTRLPGDTSNGIPHAFLFGADGKLIKEGMPDELTKNLDAELQKAPHWITGGRVLTSSAKAIGEGIKAGKPFSWALTECESVLKKKDDKATEEAEFLKAQILAYGDTRLAAAAAAESTDPVQAMAIYGEVSTGWKKFEPATKADSKVKDLKADKAFQDELKIGKTVAQVRALAETLILPEGKEAYDLTSGPNAPAAQQIQAGAKQLKTKHADSPQVKKLVEDLKVFGISI